MTAYPWSHRKERLAALRRFRDGDPCPLCPQPMREGEALDLDHVTPIVVGGAVDGPRRLAHASCNRREGAALGNRLRGQRDDDSGPFRRRPAVTRAVRSLRAPRVPQGW